MAANGEAGPLDRMDGGTRVGGSTVGISLPESLL